MTPPFMMLLNPSLSFLLMQSSHVACSSWIDDERESEGEKGQFRGEEGFTPSAVFNLEDSLLLLAASRTFSLSFSSLSLSLCSPDIASYVEKP